MDAFLGAVPDLVKDWGPPGFVIIIVLGIWWVQRQQGKDNQATAEKLRADQETTITRKNAELDAERKRNEALQAKNEELHERVSHWRKKWEAATGLAGDTETGSESEEP